MNRRVPETAGFTLVEMMVVLVIVAVLATIAAPSLRMDGFRRAPRDTLSDLRQLCRARAIESGRSVEVVLAPAIERAWILNRESAIRWQPLPLTVPPSRGSRTRFRCGADGLIEDQVSHARS